MSTGDKGIAKKQQKFKILAYYVRIPTFSDTDLAQAILYLASSVSPKFEHDIERQHGSNVPKKVYTGVVWVCIQFPCQIFRVGAVAVQGMARMLGRHLHVVTSQEQSTKQGYSVNKITSNSNSGRDPLLFGRVGEHHFISLGNNDGVV
ncbi:hypothetical protein LSAT2_023166 [Lamellibrachia satsuma]|nr:hypothetical protein LSAT2_023166 [Lamellibrachia satsuma]